MPAGPAPRIGRYESIGCVTDPNNGGRALQGASTRYSDMDNAKCVKFCLGQGYHYAGIEFGTECKSLFLMTLFASRGGCTDDDDLGYCGNEIRTATGAQKVDCPVLSMMTCPANVKQWCGGSKLMNVWWNSDPNLK